MPEITIKYKNKRTLQALRDFAKYFDFSIITSEISRTDNFQIKGVTIVSASNSIDIKEMENIFSNRKIDPKQLRQNSWQRTR